MTKVETVQFTTPQYSSIMMSKLYKFLAAEELCDVFISSDNVLASAHSFMLAAASPFMLRYISSFADNCSKNIYHEKIVIPVTSITKMMDDSMYNCMDCILKIIGYIYTGCIGISDDHFDHIVNITCNLEIKELLAICQDYNQSKTDSHDTILSEDRPFSAGQHQEKLFKPFYNSNEISNYSISSGIPLKTKHFCDKISHGKFNCHSLKRLSKNVSNCSDDFERSTIRGNTFLECNKTMQSFCRNNCLNICDCDDSSILKNNVPSHGKCAKDVFGKIGESVSEDANSTELCLDSYSPMDNRNLKDTKNDFLSKTALPEVSLNTSASCTTVYKRTKHYTFTCSFCSFGCNSYQRAKRHLLKEKHGVKCMVCSREFNSNDDLIGHINQEHKLTLFFTCYVCSKNFKSRHSLKSHLLTHNDSVSIVKCETCGLSFKSKSEMEMHILKSHTNSEKACDFCSYKTKFASYLKRHLLKHYRKLLTCPVQNCGFSTVWKKNLKSHIKTHQVSQKAFNCSSCSSGFSLKKNLQRHIFLMHSRSKVFSCPKCKYTNKRFDKLKAHYSKAHGEYLDKFTSVNEQNIVSNHIVPPAAVNSIDRREDHYEPLISFGCEKADKACVDSKSGRENSERVVYLNESTGELTFFCDSDGKPLQGVPDVITVHSIGGMKNNNNFDDPNSSTGPFLNEITGELTGAQLNFNLADSTTVEKPTCPSPEVTVTVLDETTGEITSKHEQITVEQDNNIIDFDNIFDTIDFDAMNDDSLDGFDDFDNALFDAEFNIGPSSPDMDRILNEFTGELFTEQSISQYRLDKHLQSHLWENKNSLSCKGDDHTDSHNEELSQIFLDEVTGELIGEFSSI